MLLDQLNLVGIGSEVESRSGLIEDEGSGDKPFSTRLRLGDLQGFPSDGVIDEIAEACIHVRLRRIMPVGSGCFGVLMREGLISAH